jgi:hypothetical protein
VFLSTRFNRSLSRSEGATYLTNAIHEFILILDVHGLRFKQITGSFYFHLTSGVHLIAGLFDHIDPVTHIAPQSDIGIESRPISFGLEAVCSPLVVGIRLLDPTPGADSKGAD